MELHYTVEAGSCAILETAKERLDSAQHSLLAEDSTRGNLGTYSFLSVLRVWQIYSLVHATQETGYSVCFTMLSRHNVFKKFVKRMQLQQN